MREIDSYEFSNRKSGARAALADGGLAELAELAEFADFENDFDDGFEDDFGDGPERGRLTELEPDGASSFADFASQYKRGYQYGDEAGIADTCDRIHVLTKAQSSTLRTVAAQVATLSAEVAELTVLLRKMASALSERQA
jgi:hypothetical protein